MPVNPQFPFAFQRRDRLNKKVPKYPVELSRNIKGICINCRKTYQRLRKFDSAGQRLSGVILCPRCLLAGYRCEVIEIPEELRPWKIYPWGFNYYFEQRFTCAKCLRVFAGYSHFGALCNHKLHMPPSGWLCRLCCTKVDPDVMISKKEKKAKNLKVVDVQVDVQLDELNAAIRGANQGVAPAPIPLNDPIDAFEFAWRNAEVRPWRNEVRPAPEDDEVNIWNNEVEEPF